MVPRAHPDEQPLAHRHAQTVGWQAVEPRQAQTQSPSSRNQERVAAKARRDPGRGKRRLRDAHTRRALHLRARSGQQPQSVSPVLEGAGAQVVCQRQGSNRGRVALQRRQVRTRAGRGGPPRRRRRSPFPAQEEQRQERQEEGRQEEG